MKLLTKAELPKAIESITKRGKLLDNDIHVAACSAIALRKETGDTAWINRLYLALPKGTRAVALASWYISHGGVIANAGQGKAEQPFLHTKDKQVDLEAGMEDPWFDHKPDPSPDTVFDVMALVMAILKKSKTTKGEVKHGEMLASLAAIVEAGSLSSNMESDESDSSPSDETEGESAQVPGALLLSQPSTDVLNAVSH